MKRAYIKPVTKQVTCRIQVFMATSPTGTIWGTNTGGTDQIIDDKAEPSPEPDPEGATSRSIWGRDGMWDE